MRAALGLAVLLFAAALPARALEVDRALDRLLDRLERASSQVQSMRGDFTQRSRIKLFKQELSSTGRLSYGRPRRIRWEYLAPDPSTLVLDGDRATLRSPGAPPQTFDLARDPNMRAVFDQLALWLGAGSLGSARSGYELSASGSEAQPVLSMTPRAGTSVARTFARIELRFDAHLLLHTILLREVSGDEKEITFSHMERNVALPPDTFVP